MKDIMSKQCRPQSKLRLDPIRLSQTAWYYEEPQGICVVAEEREEGRLIGVTKTIIPWHKLKSSLARHEDKR